MSYLITEIDHESFPADCHPHLADDDLPKPPTDEGEAAGDSDINAVFHRLWTKAVHQDGYDKTEWQLLSRMLGTRGIVV